MDSFIGGTIGWIPQYVIEPIKTRFRIIRNLGDNIEELKGAAEKLDGRTKDEREKQKEAKKQEGVGASADAERWFSQADEAVSEANILRTRYEERQSRGVCSNCFCFLSGYQLSKRAFNLKKSVNDLYVEDPKFGWTAASTSQTGKQMNTVSLKGQTTRGSLKDEIIQGLMVDDKYVVVGLHGMGGVGKTTLLKHVYNHFTNTKHFDSVIFTTVSATPDLAKLRKEILKGFGLKDCDDDNNAKEKLSRQTGKYLLILDDMWEPPVDLEEICIPAPTKENSCKIVMASRSLRVITKFVNQFAGVDSLLAIPVNKLQPHEAWNLFVKKVGNSLITSEIKPLAEKIVKKCDGLPLAITVVGSTMSTRQTKGEWKDALREVGQLSKANLEDIEEKVFKLFRFSFEKLSPLEKSLFLYCCLFPEGAYIWKDRLYRFGIGEKAICDEMLTLGDMRGKVDVLVGNLKNTSMLEGADFSPNRWVKMHDVLREFGLWIASPKIIAKEAGKVFTSEWSKATMVSLYSVESMPHQLSDVCPNLDTLMLSAKKSANMNIPQAHFLEYMPALKILHLDHFDGIKKFPPSISHLVNLRLLSLRWCDSLTELPHEIGMLVQLMSLDLGHCRNLRRLPVEMKELKIFRHLDICSTRLKRIPCGVLSGLHRLEEIESEESGLKLDNDNILELYQLDQLTPISEIHVWKMKVVSNLLKQLAKWSFRDLEFWDCDIDSSVLLDFLQFPLDFTLVFGSCKGLTRVPNCDHITTLQVDRCRDLKTLVVVEEEKVDESNNIIAFQKLEELALFELDGLETICSGRVPPQQSLGPGSSCLFSNLERIVIVRCHKLKVLFTSGVTPLLLNLEDLMVLDCSQLEYLLIEDNDNDNMESFINAFPKLDEVSLLKLPELKAIYTSNNTNSQHPMDLMKWPSLESACVYDCPKLKLGTPPFGAARLIEDGTNVMSVEKEIEEWRKMMEDEQEDDHILECMD